MKEGKLCGVHWDHEMSQIDGAKRCVRCGKFSRDGVPREFRFWAKVDKSGECWLWTGAKNWAGYGLFAVGGTKLMIAHRYAWMISGKELPDYKAGVELDHICKDRLCVRTEHLRVVTHQENIKNTRWYGQCRKGHPHVEGSFKVISKSGKKRCLVCRADRIVI